MTAQAATYALSWTSGVAGRRGGAPRCRHDLLQWWERRLTGATVVGLAYTLDGTGENVTEVALKLSGDTSGETAAIGFNGGATTDCAAGGYDGTTNTDYTCTVTQATSTLDSTEVVVN